MESSGEEEEHDLDRGLVNVDEISNMKQFRGSGKNAHSADAHDDVDLVLLELGLPLSVVTQSKEISQSEMVRMKNTVANPNDLTDPFVVDALHQLRALKKQAVAKEDFLEARRLKSIIVLATRISKRISALQGMADAHETSNKLASATDTHLSSIEAIKNMGLRAEAQKEMKKHREREINNLKEELDLLLPQKRLSGHKKKEEPATVDEELTNAQAEIVVAYDDNAAAKQRRHLDEILRDWVWSAFQSVQHPPELTSIQLHEYDFLIGTFGKYVFQCLLSGHKVLRKLAIQAIDHHLPGMVAQTGAVHMFRCCIALAHLVLTINYCWEHPPHKSYVLDMLSYRATIHLILTLYTCPLKIQDKDKKGNTDEKKKQKESGDPRVKADSDYEHIDPRESFCLFKDVPPLTMKIGAIKVIPCMLDMLKFDAHNTIDNEESEICKISLNGLHYLSAHSSIGIDLIGRMIIPSIDNIGTSALIVSQLTALKSIVGHHGYVQNTCLVREVVLPSIAMCLCHHDPFVRRIAHPVAILIYGIENNKQATSYVLRTKGLEDSMLRKLEADYEKTYTIPYSEKMARKNRDEAMGIRKTYKHDGPFYTKRRTPYHDPCYFAQGRQWHDITKEEADRESDEEEDVMKASLAREKEWKRVEKIIRRVDAEREKKTLEALERKVKNAAPGVSNVEKKALQMRVAAIHAARVKKANMSNRAKAAKAMQSAADSFRARLGLSKKPEEEEDVGGYVNPLAAATAKGGLMKFSAILKGRQAIANESANKSKAVEPSKIVDEKREGGTADSRADAANSRAGSRAGSRASSRATTANSAQSEGDVRWRGLMDAEVPLSTLERAERRAKRKQDKADNVKNIKKALEHQNNAAGDGDDTLENEGIDYFAENEFDVEFPRGPLGVSFDPAPGEDEGGVVVKSLTPGGFAERCDKLKLGDKLVAVKDEVVTAGEFRDIIRKIKDAERPLLLRFLRRK